MYSLFAWLVRDGHADIGANTNHVTESKDTYCDCKLGADKRRCSECTCTERLCRRTSARQNEVERRSLASQREVGNTTVASISTTSPIIMFQKRLFAGEVVVLFHYRATLTFVRAILTMRRRGVTLSRRGTDSLPRTLFFDIRFGRRCFMFIVKLSSISTQGRSSTPSF